MACRISKKAFDRIAQEEAEKIGLHEGVWAMSHDPMEPFNLAEVEQRCEIACLNRKAIQSLVDEPEQARPIIQNLLRWAKEHGAK